MYRQFIITGKNNPSFFDFISCLILGKFAEIMLQKCYNKNYRGVEVVFMMIRRGLICLAALGLVGCGGVVGANPHPASVMPEMIAGQLVPHEIMAGDNNTMAHSEQNWVEIAGGRYSTDFDKGMKNRNENLRIACGVIDGVVLQVGETFSFNEHIGLATKEKGYLPAKIFINGKETEGLGGGICQLSSTLYNAAELSGMTIVERHPHSRRVYYVPKGRDAATAYGGVDLKFRNDLKHPVRIKAVAENGKNSVWFERL